MKNHNAQKIAGLLHELRSPAAGFNEAHQLAEILHQANYDDCKLALLEFCRSMLIASRNIAQMQIDAATVQAKRDAGSLQ